MIKKIAPRILLLATIVVLSNFIYKATTYPSDIEGDANVLAKFQNAQSQADVLYFSSSPNATYSDREDTDFRSISAIVDDSISLKVMSVDTGAIHAGVFKHLIGMISSESKVKKVIVHLNYRSFGQGWIQSELENAIQREMVFYNENPAIINRYLQGLNAYDAVSNKERERLMLKSWATEQLPFEPPRNTVTSWCEVEKWGEWTILKRQLADHYIKNFAFNINEDNVRLKDYDEIVKICEAKGLDLYFVILPENLEEGEALVDSGLTDFMKDNKDFLKKRYEEKGVTVIDDFGLLHDEDFLERTFPSEHYFERGRMEIAKSIIKVLK